MTSRCFDSSTLTQIRQNRALYSYNASRNSAVLTGASVRPEQPGQQQAGVVTQRNLGGPSATISQGIVEQGCACSGFTTNSAQGYPANQSSA
jgi:hypothetical protein